MITYEFVVERLLCDILIFPLGVQGLRAFFCHVFIPEQSAVAIGWEPSPFQYEVGVANLGIGLASFYAAFAGFHARAAVAVMVMCFLVGAGIGHVKHIAFGDSRSRQCWPDPLYGLPDADRRSLFLLMFTQCKPAGNQPAEAVSTTHVEEAIESSARPRIEDELEKARQAMRESLKAAPTTGSSPATGT